MPNKIESEIQFISRDSLFDTVKPYSFRFDPPDELPRENVERKTHTLTIRDARKLDPKLDIHGFTLMTVTSHMSYDDFTRPDKIAETYVKDLESALTIEFQARRVKVIDYLVEFKSRRSLAGTNVDSVGASPPSQLSKSRQ